jgi:hypothetical protein
MGLLEQGLLSKMGWLGVSRQTLARIGDVRETTLCRGLRNIEPLSNSEIERLNLVLDDLKKLRKLVEPLELPLTDTRKLHILLNRFRDGDLAEIVNPAIAAELAAQIDCFR